MEKEIADLLFFLWCVGRRIMMRVFGGVMRRSIALNDGLKRMRND